MEISLRLFRLLLNYSGYSGFCWNNLLQQAVKYVMPMTRGHVLPSLSTTSTADSLCSQQRDGTAH